MTCPIPPNEAARLAALHNYHILDSESEQSYDDITKLVAIICETPMSTLSLVDANRQWFKSKVGISDAETPREVAFCAHTICQPDLLMVEDATQDERFRTSPLVTDNPGVRFYAGMPLVTPEGYGIGALCAIDTKPRRLNDTQLAALAALSRVVMTQLELRRVSAELASALKNVRTLTALLPICSYCKRIRSDAGYWSEVDKYMSAHAATQFKQCICPDCVKKHFGG